MIKLVLSVLTLLLGAVGEPSAADSNLNQLFDDYWSAELERNPFAATYAGVNTFNDRVPQVAPADQQARVRQLEGFQKRLRRSDLAKLDEDQRLNVEILRFILKHDIALAAYDPWRIPLVSDSGFHSEFGFVLGATPLRTVADYRVLLRRLERLPAYIDQNVENMRLGIRQSFTQPGEILAKILPSFEAQVTERAEDHPIYKPFQELPSGIAAQTATELREAAIIILEKEIIPAYARALTFMRDEYMPAARQTLGASALANGSEYYTALVRYYTTLDNVSADEIHARGLGEVKRIRAEMDTVINETGFDGSFSEFLQFLRSDPQFYPKTAEELLMRAAWIAKKTDGRLPAYFGKLPRQPYSVEPVPMEIAANYTGGRYVASSPGGMRGGQYWVNTYALETRALYQLPALSLHEGVPGHHLQIALAYEIENVPVFRQHFYPHAYGEGWGLYSEKLGVEMGIYTTPYEHFGRLSYEMWRACRLVVDTGIHAMNWTRDEAVDYLASNTALSLHEVNTEIDRYIAWPAQALAYKMGELTLWELRRHAEKTLGEKFDIRDFHDAVLAGGGLPLDLLRQQIGAHIKSQQKK